MVFPERLREGDTVGLVSPAFPVKEEGRLRKAAGGHGVPGKAGHMS